MLIDDALVFDSLDGVISSPRGNRGHSIAKHPQHGSKRIDSVEWQCKLLKDISDTAIDSDDQDKHHFNLAMDVESYPMYGSRSKSSLQNLLKQTEDVHLSSCPQPCIKTDKQTSSILGRLQSMSSSPQAENTLDRLRSIAKKPNETGLTAWQKVLQNRKQS